MKIYVINLDRDPDRMRFTCDQFDAVGLGNAVTRFPAIDGRAPDFHAPGYAPHSWRDRWTLSRSEQAVFESHRAIWARVAASESSGAVVCEDDILVSRAFARILPGLDLQRFPVIKLDGFNTVHRFGPAIRMGHADLRPIFEAVPSAACYALSRQAARRLLRDSDSYCETLDDFLFRRREGLQPVQLFPAVAVQGMCCDLSRMDRAPDHMHESAREKHEGARDPADKGPAAYRLAKELRRTMRKLRWQVRGDRQLLRRGGYIGAVPLADDLGRYR